MSIFKAKHQKGFTLVELLVVIAIIGILSTLLLLQLGIARQRARDAKRIADVNQTRTAVELYYDDNSSYPQVATFGTSDSTGLGPLLAPKYLTHLPVDPLNNSEFLYGYAYSGTTKYQVHAELEQHAQALNSDVDINSTVAGWSGQTVNGTVDSACVLGTPNDCVYDQGQP